MQYQIKDNRPYHLEALPEIKIPDDFDKIAVSFDKFFGILNSDKSISLNDMDNAIKIRGGQLTN